MLKMGQPVLDLEMEVQGQSPKDNPSERTKMANSVEFNMLLQMRPVNMNAACNDERSPRGC